MCPVPSNQESDEVGRIRNRTMTALNNALLGVTFMIVAAVAMLIMFRVWAFPYDHERHRSQAPKGLILVHRLLGYAFIVIYVYLMFRMVPRMWTYQIELPARTVAHLATGFTIGALLVAKIVVVRFYKHMEAKLAPFLGTALFVCTVLLMGLALPIVFREYLLGSQALSGEAFEKKNLHRIKEYLPKTGLSDNELIQELSTREGLMAGREVLKRRCTQCHDLRTVLARPRTPSVWRETVRRMANRSTVLQSITEREQWQVTAYLIAISPTLQKTLKQRRSLDLGAAQTQDALRDAEALASNPEFLKSSPYVPGSARAVFEVHCGQCHELSQVEQQPPRSDSQIIALIGRMVRNGLRADKVELVEIIRYLRATYVDEPTTRLPAPQSADETVVVRPEPGNLRFAATEITVPVGAPVTVILDNAGAQMRHNLTVIRASTDVEAVTVAALRAAETDFIPAHPAVLASTGTVEPGARGTLTLTFSSEGDYPFVCLVPGHSSTMRGVLRARVAPG